MNTTACPPATLPQPQAAWRRWWADALLRWRERALARAQWRALQGLSDAALRDIGLAEKGRPRLERNSLADYERPRW
jgi:hypothetical protein